MLFVNLGFWQLRRLDERQSENATIVERVDAPAQPAGQVLPAGSDRSAEAVEYRRVTVAGAYVAGDSVLVRSRSLDGAPGSWVLTPLRLDDGTGVVVNRGWIGNDGRFDAVPDTVTTPEGTVTVTGLVRASQTRQGSGPTDPATGRLASLARADVARLDQQVDLDLRAGYVQLRSQEPAVPDGAPRPLPEPALDEGPHLSYAAQWFIFASIGAVGYPLILRRTAREQEAGTGDPDAPDPDDHLSPGDPRLDSVR